MADSPLLPLPGSGAAAIRVSPADVGAAGAQVRTIGVVTGADAAMLQAGLIGHVTAAVGDPAAGGVLDRTARLVTDAIASAGQGIEELGWAMAAASLAYRLSDTSAVSPGAG